MNSFHSPQTLKVLTSVDADVLTLTQSVNVRKLISFFNNQALI